MQIDSDNFFYLNGCKNRQIAGKSRQKQVSLGIKMEVKVDKMQAKADRFSQVFFRKKIKAKAANANAGRHR